MATTVISVSMQKGGVGKTTTTANLGCAFAEQGKRVLVIDIDPQGALTISMGFDPLQFEATTYHLFLEEKSLSDIIVSTQIPNLDLAPTNIDLCGTEAHLSRSKSGGMMLGWERILINAIQSVQDKYDIVLIDNPPTFGALMTNALTAAHLILIPLQCSYLTLRALELLHPIIAEIREKVNPSVDVRILRTMFDSRTRHAKEVSEQVVAQEGDHVLATKIKNMVSAADATIGGKPVVAFEPKSDVAVAYCQLAEELTSFLK